MPTSPLGGDYEYGPFSGLSNPDTAQTASTQTTGAQQPSSGGYVPTGGQNDPNTWQTNPGFGQDPGGANHGAGYNPAYWADKGGFAAYKAGRKAYRSQFQPGGSIYDRNQQRYAQIYAANPQSWGQIADMLASMGVYDVKEQGKHFYNEVKGMFDGTGPIGNYQVLGGQKKNMGTSDVNAGWEPLSASDKNWMGMNFQQKLGSLLGLGSVQRWAKQGKTGFVKGPDGKYTNTTPAGVVQTLDPRTGLVYENGQVVGFYGQPRF